jgi:hypothetical protein
MLEKKHLRKLKSGKHMAQHLHPFLHKWLYREDRPQHITHMIKCLAEMDIHEQRKFWFSNDELFYIEKQRPKLHRIDK